MLKVTKFGGSSLSSQSQFKKVKDIVLGDNMRKVVVVSAVGRRDSNDSKITDLLYILHAHLKYSVPYEEIWNLICGRFLEIKKQLKLNFDIEGQLDCLRQQLSKNISEDYLVSRGEYLTALLMSDYLGFRFLDAKDLIVFNYDGTIDLESTEKNTNNHFDGTAVVVPGFYGAYPNGTIKLLSRGGSDVTGSILAKCIGAEVYENWTDVSGILMADPRIVKNPKAIKEITYGELRELSYMGANVLHEDSIFPVQDAGIPIKILNTNDPTSAGTIITSECQDNSQIITGIAGKKDFVSFTITKAHMSTEVGFLAKTFSIFEKYGVSVEHLPSGIDTVSVVTSKDQVEKCLFEIVTEIKTKLDADVELFDDMAVIAIVGRNMANQFGLSGKLFTVLGDHKVNLKMIDQGPQELNIIIGIKNCDYERTIRIIYDNLIV